MATTMGFAHVGFLVLLCLSFCSARRVLTDSTDVEKPNFAPSNFQATQSTGGISNLGDSKWQSGGKGGHCSGGGGGGGGGGGNCGNFGCGGGGGYSGGNGDCGRGYACGGGGGGGNYQGGCYYPPPPTCYPVSCPPVSNCCPVGCSPGYGQPKVAAQRWANWQAQPKPQVRPHYGGNSKVPPSPKMTHSQAPPRPQVSHDEHKPNILKSENYEIHSEPKFNADNDSNPNHSDKERQLEQMTEIDGKTEAAQPGSDGQMQEDFSKN